MFFPSCFSKKYLIPLSALSLWYRKSRYGCCLLKANKRGQVCAAQFALFWMPATGSGGGEGHKGPFSPPADSPLPDSTPTVGGGLVKGFIDRGRGCLQKQQSALTVILKLVTSGLASFSFAVLGAVNLSSRVSLFPFL